MTHEKRVLTGDRPTGRLHLGHWVGSIQNRLKLQNDDSISKRLYMVADIQALTDNYDNPAKVRDNVMQVLLDNMACGLDPAKTTMFVQSMVPEIAELTVLFLNLVTVNRLLENPTVKSEIIEKGWNAGKLSAFFGEGLGDDTNRPGVPAGFLCYPVSQAADILFARANLIPVGADQRPMIEQTNEIAAAFNRIYNTDLFPHVDIMVGETARLVGIDGNAKMSKSLGNTIYLSDSREQIVKQVKSAYTCPSKVRVTDTVTAEELAGNVIFQYLDIFDAEHANEIAEMKQAYMAGDVGDMSGKERLIEVLDGLLSPIRERRAELEQDMNVHYDTLRTGIAATRALAAETMQSVRGSMGINYF